KYCQFICGIVALGWHCHIIGYLQPRHQEKRAMTTSQAKIRMAATTSINSTFFISAVRTGFEDAGQICNSWPRLRHSTQDRTNKSTMPGLFDQLLRQLCSKHELLSTQSASLSRREH